MEDYVKPYVEILRDLREDNDLTQKQVADIVGLTQQQYSRYELGKSQLPVWVLLALADFYGLSTEYLLGRGTPKAGATQDKSGMLADIFALSKHNRQAVRDYIDLLKIKEAWLAQKDTQK